MNTELNLIVNITEKLLIDLTKHNERTESSRKAIIKRMNKYNGTDLDPIVSVTGRIHAPIDGYVLPDDLINSLAFDVEAEKTYAKGQFLPMTFTGDDYMVYEPSSYNFKLEYKTRIKVPEYIADHLMDYVPAIKLYEIGKGSSWVYKGESQCYIYVKTFKRQYHEIFQTVIADYLDSIKDAEPLVKQEPKGIAPTGKVEVTGRVVSLRDVETYNDGYNVSYSTKAMIVLENESTIYGTIPSKISDCEKGDIITFTATFTHAQDDETHSFYKRPSKAKIVKRAS